MCVCVRVSECECVRRRPVQTSKGSGLYLMRLCGVLKVWSLNNGVNRACLLWPAKQTRNKDETDASNHTTYPDPHALTKNQARDHTNKPGKSRRSQFHSLRSCRSGCRYSKAGKEERCSHNVWQCRPQPHPGNSEFAEIQGRGYCYF